jgi:hypothetical protein
VRRGDQVQPGPSGQGRVDLQHGDVEGEGGEAHPCLARTQLELVGEPSMHATEIVSVFQ